MSNPWITPGMKVTCHRKRELYLSCRNGSDQNLKIIIKCTVIFYLILSQLLKTLLQSLGNKITQKKLPGTT
jgi:hypothetical protein